MEKYEEMQEELLEFIKLLIEKGYEIDLEQVDLPASIENMQMHETMDFAEVETFSDLRLAELKNLMRAVYADGSPLVNCQAEAAEGEMTEFCNSLKRLSLGICDECGEASLFGFSTKRVIRSNIQVLTRKDLVPGMFYLLYWCNKPAELIQLTSVCGRQFCFKTFSDGVWSSEKCKNLTAVGIISQQFGPEKLKVWNVQSYLEPL